MLIAGAGGLALQLLPTINRLNLQEELFFFDNSSTGPNPFIFKRYKVIRSIKDLILHFKENNREFVTGIGGNQRKQFHNIVVESGGIPSKIIDPSSSVSIPESDIGKGTIVLQDVVIEPCVSVDEGCLLNVRAIVHHDVRIGKFTEIAPSAILLGGAEVGNNCFIGAGAIILPNIKIGDYSTIGAGSVVDKNVSANQTVVGIPARPIIKR